MPRKTTKPRVTKATSGARQTAEYRHKEETPARPDVGVQPQFKKRAAPKTWRYDSSLSPALDWDANNSAREQGESLIAELERRIQNLRKRIADLPSPSGRGAGGEGGKAAAELQAELQAADAAVVCARAAFRAF